MDEDLARRVTAELRGFTASLGTRRAVPVACHVGHPDGERSSWPHGVTDDPSLRADLASRALDGLAEVEGACAWVTRGGDLAPHDADVVWLTAVRTAFARHGLVLPAFVVLTRGGWVDLVGGRRRTWQRLRVRPSGARRRTPADG